MRARIFADENKKWWTLGSLCFALFMIMLDNTVVNVALPAIKADLGISTSELEWTVAAYALIWGWQFGVGFVAMILIHELGHYVEAKRQGLDVSIPRFIPFLGAYVAIKNSPLNPMRNALVALAGPAAGGLAAAACWGVGSAQQSSLLHALAYAGFFLNLINLLPIGILQHAAEKVAQAGHHAHRCIVSFLAYQSCDGIERIEEEVGLDLPPQGIELRFRKLLVEARGFCLFIG